MLRNLGLAALLLLPLPARAEDPFASMKPLMGTWLVDRDCKVYKDRVLVAFKRLSKTVLVEFRDPKKPEAVWGKADVVEIGAEDRFRVFTSVPGHPITKFLGNKPIQGTMTVADDEDEPEGPGKDHITVSSKVSVLSSLLSIKLRDNYKRATFIFKADSPLGSQQCRGSGVKQAVKK